MARGEAAAGFAAPIHLFGVLLQCLTCFAKQRLTLLAALLKLLCISRL
jgi:hypothetical protein